MFNSGLWWGLSKIMPGRVCIGRISVLTAVTITITININIRGCLTPPRSPCPTLLPQRQDLGAPSPVGSPLPAALRVRTVRHESPPFLSHPLPLLLRGARVTCAGRGKRASWPETRHRSRPRAPVSMATARAESAARSRATGYAPAAAYVTRRAARSQTPGRSPARDEGRGGQPRRLDLSKRFSTRRLDGTPGPLSLVCQG